MEERLDEGYWQALLEEVESGTGEPALARERPRRSEAVRARGETQAWQDAEEYRREGKIVEVTVEGYNRGGLLVRLWGLDGFVPASHLPDLPLGLRNENRLEALSRWRGRSLRLQVIEVDPQERRLVLSPQLGEQVRLASRLWQELAPGDRRRGVVTRLSDFGAFVEVGGIEGLIHISELSWGRVTHPAQVLSPSQEVEVYVLQVDARRRRLALSLKRLSPDPWSAVEERYRVGQLVEGTITHVVDFGAFARLEEGVEGLVHASELAEGSFLHPHSVVREGEVLWMHILSIDVPRRRIALSLKQAAF